MEIHKIVWKTMANRREYGHGSRTQDADSYIYKWISFLEQNDNRYEMS